MNFLYWNLNRRPVLPLVVALAEEHDLDVIMLSESSLSRSDLLFSLNSDVSPGYRLPFSPVHDPLIIVKMPRASLRIVRDERGVCVRCLAPPIGVDITLIAVHLPSKLYQRDLDQVLLSTRLARIIEEEEAKAGHRRTLLVGDLNMNPFEAGVVGADGIHAVMSRSIAEKGSRTVAGRERFFFYNPMWSHFGDYSHTPPGTYYYSGSREIEYYWHMFDQVMVRRDLLDCLREDSVDILTSAGQVRLLGPSGTPDRSAASDHLPIVFALDLVKGA